MNKKGFTLVEMLIVVVVLVTLMSITFRLSAIGDSSTRRNTTVNRLQRVENCLSGYYAAFGTYPPVKLHGSRDYNQKVNNHGFQTGDDQQIELSWYTEDGDHGKGSTAEERDWKQVQAACRSQPFAARFPYPEGYNDYLKAQAEVQKALAAETSDAGTKAVLAAGYDDGYTTNPGRHDFDEIDWSESQLFEFGLMSYLTPRYIIMMNGDQMFFQKGMQWIANNTLPANPLGNGEKFDSWSEVYEYVRRARENNANEEAASIRYIPSQAVCARWMANLEKSCHCRDDNYKKMCFGIDIHADNQSLNSSGTSWIFAPGGAKSDSTSQQYVLDTLTMADGWNNELYYYSPAPYQSYTVWSAGANGRTFPPWASRDGFSAAQNKAIGFWVDDDIIHMSN